MQTHDSDDARMASAISGLMSEAIPDGAKGRTFEAMRRPARKTNLGQFVGAVSLTTIVVAVVLWPERKAMAWGQIVQSTLGSARLHHEDFERRPDGSGWRKVVEEWIDGNKNAFLANLPDQRAITIDMRHDGKRCYRLDSKGYGVVYNEKPNRRMSWRLQRYSLENLLADAHLKIDKTPTDATISGKSVFRYNAKEREGPDGFAFWSPVAFYVEKDTGRVIRTETFAPNGTMIEYSTVDYPESILDETFMPPKTGPRVFDLDRDLARLRTMMAKGVPLGNGNVLRAAMQSPSGELVILWTGTPPNGDGKQRPVVLGHPDHGIFAPDQITTSRWKVEPGTLFKFEGQPLCGLAVQINKPVTGTVDLQIPILEPNKSSPIKNSLGIVRGYRSKQAGTATVRDFPVIATMPYALLTYFNGSVQW